jgi:hypothetical protein
VFTPPRRSKSDKYYGKEKKESSEEGKEENSKKRKEKGYKETKINSSKKNPATAGFFVLC